MNEEIKRDIVEKAFNEVSKIHKYLDDPVIVSPPKLRVKTVLCGYAREEDIAGEIKQSNNLGWYVEKEIALNRIEKVLDIMLEVKGYENSHNQDLFVLVVSQTFERAMVIDVSRFIRGCAACIRDGNHDIMFRWLTNHSCCSYPGFQDRRNKERSIIRRNTKPNLENVEWFCP